VPLNAFLEHHLGLDPRPPGSGRPPCRGLDRGHPGTLAAADFFERINWTSGLPAAHLEDKERPSLGSRIAEAVYWFIFLLFLPAILGALGMQGLTAPV